ncbi:MAG: DUF429 domain-containing protein [Chloroherpetonaceae bacterium]|nr:DUF429 domain-containing protein [Chloroherpetonaceae bacterium]
MPTIRTKTFFGVDLSAKVDEITGVAAINSNRELVFVNQVKPDIAIRNYIDYHRPSIVAVDAPITLPCGKYGTYASRKCDRDITSLGIPAFATSMLAQLTFRAIAIRKTLPQRYELIEVYPQATKVRLALSVAGKKSSEEVREFTQTRLARIIKNMPRPSNILLTDDELDAILSAYTAFLYQYKLTEGCGDPSEGLIHIPLPDSQKKVAQIAELNGKGE